MPVAFVVAFNNRGWKDWCINAKDDERFSYAKIIELIMSFRLIKEVYAKVITKKNISVKILNGVFLIENIEA